MVDIAKLFAEVDANPVGWSSTTPYRRDSGESVSAPAWEDPRGYWEQLVDYLKANPSKYQTKQILRDIVQAAAQGPMAMEKAHRGRYRSWADPEMTNDLAPAMLPFSGASLGSPVPNALLSIGGMNAAKVPLSALRFAEKLERAGAKPETIWKGYGLTRDKAGNWMFEIPDDKMRLNVMEGPRPEFDVKTGAGFYTERPQSWQGPAPSDAPRGWQSIEPNARLYPHLPAGTRVGDVMEHPELFAQYPHLQNLLIDVPMDFTGSMRGAYNPNNKRVYIASGDANRVPQTLAHELGHAVQHFEEMPLGGNPAQFRPKHYQEYVDNLAQRDAQLESLAQRHGFGRDDIARLKYIVGEKPERLSRETQKFLANVENTYPKLFTAARERAAIGEAVRRMDAHAFDQYRNLHGEQNAEAIARRLELTPRQRWEQPFWEHYTTPVENHLLGDTFPWQ